MSFDTVSEGFTMGSLINNIPNFNTILCSRIMQKIHSSEIAHLLKASNPKICPSPDIIIGLCMTGNGINVVFTQFAVMYNFC